MLACLHFSMVLSSPTSLSMNVFISSLYLFIQTLSSPIISLRQINSLRTLKGITLLQLLPALDAAGLDAHHVLPAILGRKVLRRSRLVDPRVPDDHLIEVVAHDAEARFAAAARLGDDDGVLGALGRSVDAVRLAAKGDGGVGLTGKRLAVVDLVQVRGAFKARDLEGSNVLCV